MGSVGIVGDLDFLGKIGDLRSSGDLSGVDSLVVLDAMSSIGLDTGGFDALGGFSILDNLGEIVSINVFSRSSMSASTYLFIVGLLLMLVTGLQRLDRLE